MKCLPFFIKGFILALVLSTAWASCTAFAQVFGGSVELNYDHITNRTDSRITGVTEKSTVEAYVQRYNLYYKTQLTPYLRLNLGYLYDQYDTVFQDDDAVSRSMSLRTAPFLDLNLNNPWFNAGAGFRRTEQKQRPGGANLLNDSYNLNFSLKRREDRPTLNILYSRVYFYDQDRSSQDAVTNFASLSSTYALKELNLSYVLSYSDSQDRITGVETNNLSNYERISYAREFFDRISFSTNYQASQTTSGVSFPMGATGSVTSPVPPTQGIGGAGPNGSIPPPETPLFETMVSKPLLINGDVTLPTDINIGYSQLNQNFRSMGIVVAAPTDINLLYVVVNQDITALAGSYVWDVYISTDRTPIGSGPKQWTLWQQSAPVTFNAFERRFEISFPNVQTQFIKVVTRPLSSPLPVPPIDINNILVTELFAYHRITTAQASRDAANKAQTQTFDLGVRMRLLEAPFFLYYDLYYTMSEAKPQDLRQSTLSQGITALRRFSSVFSGTARIGRDDIDSNRPGFEPETVYMASASLTATPLPTLSHNLVVSAQKDITGIRVVSTQSAFLGNSAQLYTGLSVNLSGSRSSTSVSDTGGESTAETINLGISLIPHRLLSMGFNHAYSTSRQVVPGVTAYNTRTTVDGVYGSYTPVPAIYLAASYDVTDTLGAPTKTANENFSASWSPFAGGRLTFSYFYNQLTALPSRDKTTNTGLTALWRVNDRLFLSLTRSLIKIDTASALTDSVNTSANVRWIF